MMKALHITIWVAFFTVLFVTLGFVNKEQQKTTCSGLNINIDKTHGNYFIVEDDIKELFLNHGYNIEQAASDINITHIERLISKYPAVEKANVYAGINGSLNVDIVQRKPIVRVFCLNGESYYIDEKGWLMPLSRTYAARVVVANGQINEPYALRYKVNAGAMPVNSDSIPDNETLSRIYKVANYITNDEFWKSQVNQIYVRSDGDIELIPRVGNHVILVGDANELKEKFAKLEVFYKKGLNKTGWNEFKEINLKYNNQVICKKR